MQEKTKTEILSENLIKAFVQFKRLRMNENNPKYKAKLSHCLKHSEVMLLFDLKELEKKFSEGVSVSTISQSLGVKPPSSTPVITNLEKKHLIERTMDSNDRRIIRVKLTEEGIQFIETNKQLLITKITGLVEYLGEEKSETLASLINETFSYFNNKDRK